MHGAALKEILWKDRKEDCAEAKHTKEIYRGGTEEIKLLEERKGDIRFNDRKRLEKEQYL